MEYNTQRDKLMISQYGRNIQKLIRKAVEVEDDAKRQEMVEAIIKLMGQLNPQMKTIEDYQHKFWDHLHLISDFKMEVDSPYPVPTEEELFRKPEHIGYPSVGLKFPHYGQYVESLTKLAGDMEEGEKKQEFARIVANYMKLVYRSRSRETVTDDLIKSDLKRISQGDLVVEPEVQLANVAPKPNTNNSNNNNRRSNKRSNNNKKKGNNRRSR